MQKVDVLEAFIAIAAIFGMGLIWTDLSEKVFKRSAVSFLYRSQPTTTTMKVTFSALLTRS